MITLFTTHKPRLSNCPAGLKDNIINWRLNNPTFDFRYYNHAEMLTWMKVYAPEKTYKCLELLNTGAGMADVFRICRMNIEGGVWVDADLPAFDITKSRPDFENILDTRHTVFVKNAVHENPRYMVMASKPESKILKMLIERVTDLVFKSHEEKLKLTTVNVTGPFVLHNLLCEALNISSIKELKVEKDYGVKDMPFIYIDDIVPMPDVSCYEKYRNELSAMKITHHFHINAVKF